MRIKKVKEPLLFKFYNENRKVYVIWNNSEEALQYILKNEMFSKEIFKFKKVSSNTRLLISLDLGKNYIYLNKVLKLLECKLKEPYILNNKYIYKIRK